MLKKRLWGQISLVLLLVAGLIAACGVGDWEESPEDCFPDEVYDEVDKFCYPAVDCEGEDCEFYEEDVIDLFFGLVDEFFGAQDWESENFTYGDEEEILVTYQIDGNRISDPEYASVIKQMEKKLREQIKEVEITDKDLPLGKSNRSQALRKSN